MRILTRYILREVLSHALLGLLLFTFALFARDVGRLLEVLVRRSAPPETVLWIFLLTLPTTLSLTIPMAVLVGILIGLSRMSSDGEVVATRAAGLSVVPYAKPVLGFALAATLLSGYVSIYLAPRAVREFVRIQNTLAASQAPATVQPRVFEESFPNLVLYVNDVRGEGNDWRGVFLADTTGAHGPKVTFAERASITPDPSRNNLQLHLVSGSTHELTPKPEEYVVSSFAESDTPITLAPPQETARAKPFTERYFSELWAFPLGHPDRALARVELHRRLALPAACLVLALVGIPLGLSSQRGGKSMGVILTVLLVFAYYMLFVAGISMARQGKMGSGRAVWIANAFFLALGLALLLRVDRSTVGAGWSAWLRAWSERRRKRRLGARSRPLSSLPARWIVNFPQLIDGYLVRGFVFYFLVTLAGFVLLAEAVTFFDLLNDIYRNRASAATIVTYFVYLAPQLLYVMTPISVLVTVLVTFGLHTKRNEFTAMKACGVSLYRASLPVFLAAAALSGALFAFDHAYLPEANKKQEALRGQIKGRPPQTYYRPDRRWIFGQQTRVFYYNFFEPTENVMGGVTVFDLDPRTFQLRRRIFADRAQWSPRLNNWVFENGWVRELEGINVTSFRPFAVQTFSEIDEQPAYFKKEAKQSNEMNFRELKRYMDDLHQAGFDIVKLSVQFHRKFAYPLFALIMALIAVPFAFSVGQRGALAGIAVSIGIAILYWLTAGLFENMGNIGELPAAVAAWSPDVLFGLTGIYLLLKVRT